MDYIANLKNPKQFKMMVQRLSEKPQFQSMDEEQKMELLQRLASNRPQKAPLTGEMDADGISSVATGDGTASLETTGTAALSGSQGRLSDSLVESAKKAAGKAVVTTGVGMALGGATLEEALGAALDPKAVGLGAIGAVPQAMLSGMGIGQDLGVVGKVGKGMLSMFLGAANPALAIAANVAGTAIADFGMDWADARAFEGAKDRMENLMGQLPARAGLDYGAIQNLAGEFENEDEITFTELRDTLAGKLESMSEKEQQKYASTFQALDDMSYQEQKELAKREYSVLQATQNVTPDQLQASLSKLEQYGLDPRDIRSYTPEDEGTIFGPGGYERMSEKAREKVSALHDQQRSKALGMEVSELKERQQLAKEKGLTALTGTKMQQALNEKREAERVAEAKAQAEANARKAAIAKQVEQARREGKSSGYSDKVNVMDSRYSSGWTNRDNRDSGGSSGGGGGWGSATASDHGGAGAAGGYGSGTSYK